MVYKKIRRSGFSKAMTGHLLDSHTKLSRKLKEMCDSSHMEKKYDIHPK